MIRARLPLESRAPDVEARRSSRLDTLVADHFDFVWRQLRHQGLSPEDADDGAQQVFMIATQKLSEIAEGRERSFLYGTALRVAANRRRATRRDAVRNDTPESLTATTVSPDAETELHRVWAFLDELLARLPPELARVIVLAEIEELKVSEIAALEEIPTGTAASRLRRAREAFHELLRDARDRNPFNEGRR